MTPARPPHSGFVVSLAQSLCARGVLRHRVSGRVARLERAARRDPPGREPDGEYRPFARPACGRHVRARGRGHRRPCRPGRVERNGKFRPGRFDCGTFLSSGSRRFRVSRPWRSSAPMGSSGLARLKTSRRTAMLPSKSFSGIIAPIRQLVGTSSTKDPLDGGGVLTVSRRIDSPAAISAASWWRASNPVIFRTIFRVSMWGEQGSLGALYRQWRARRALSRR